MCSVQMEFPPPKIFGYQLVVSVLGLFTCPYDLLLQECHLPEGHLLFVLVPCGVPHAHHGA